MTLSYNGIEDEDDEEEEDEYDDDNESYDSVASLKKENSPPFKQAKFDRSDHKSLLNSVYSSRMSMISNHDKVLHASHSGMNLNKNYIEANNSRKKCQYICKKVFLHLPSSLYRLKLNTIELDSFEASKLSVMSNQIKHADFLQEFSIFRQSYPLQSDEDLNKLVMFIESAFKDVFTIEGDESAFLEILIIFNFVLYI